MSDAAFASAVFYDCQDPEYLNHDTPEEAIADLFEGLRFSEPNDDVSVLIANVAPLKVTAWARKEVSNVELEVIAGILAESAVEQIDEDYGDPEGDSGGGVHELNLALYPVLKKWVTEHYKVWSCVAVASCFYTAAELDTLLRKQRPEWFT